MAVSLNRGTPIYHNPYDRDPKKVFRKIEKTQMPPASKPESETPPGS